jgi:hypothetical protein
MLTALIGRFGFRKTAVGRALGRWNALYAVLLQHILQALVFASQSSYPGLQKKVYILVKKVKINKYFVLIFNFSIETIATIVTDKEEI